MALNYGIIREWLSETKEVLSKFKEKGDINITYATDLLNRYDTILATLRRQIDLEDEGWLTTNPLPPDLYAAFTDTYELLKKSLSSL